MKKIKVKYSSNNSGGSWWLKDEDWKNLEKAGWNVEWVAEESDSFLSSMNKDGRWLGALATTASKSFPSVQVGIKEWEKITGQKADVEGCNCCGAPHTFYWGGCSTGTCKCPDRKPHKDYNYASGEDVLNLMFKTDKSKLTKRELLELLK